MSEQIEFLKQVEMNIGKKIKEALDYVKGARKEQQTLRDIIKELKNHK